METRLCILANESEPPYGASLLIDSGSSLDDTSDSDLLGLFDSLGVSVSFFADGSSIPGSWDSD